jgi:hypothetical protein
MTDPFSDPAFEIQVSDEFARIGIQGGVNLGPRSAFTAEQMLEALRMTPDGAGVHAFFAKLTELLGGDSGP